MKPPIILLIEDNPDDVYFVKRALRSAAIEGEIQVAGDGQEAMDQLTETLRRGNSGERLLPDLILLDLQLPRVRGLDVLRWIREQPALQTLRVVVLTGSVDDSDTKRALHLGAISYLLKPPTTAMMEEIIRPQLLNPPAPAKGRSVEQYVGIAIMAVLVVAGGGLLYLALH